MYKTICKTATRTLVILGLMLIQFYAFAQSATYLLDVKQSKLFWKGTKTIGTKHYGFLLFNSGWLHTNVAGKLNDGVFSMNMKSISSTEHEKKVLMKK